MAVLWCVVLLSVTVFGMLHSTRLDLRVAKNHGDREQAYYLALAGIEKAKAMIYAEAQERRTSGADFRSMLLDQEAAFRDFRLGRGVVRVYRHGTEEEGRHRLVYGLSDEESRLNVNVASAEQLAKLPGLEPAVAAALRDWVDSNDEMTAQGAEQPYYAELDPPYEVRNGPFETLQEMLMVRGVHPELLLGEDANANGILDPEERDGDQSRPMDDGDEVLDRGWSEYLSLESADRNVDARGERRTDLGNASEDELAEIDGITSEIAKAIVAHRGKNSLKSLADLLDVQKVEETQPSAPQAPPPAANRSTGTRDAGPAPSGTPTQTRSDFVNPSSRSGSPDPAGGPSPTASPIQSGGPGQSGVKLIDRDLLKSIADELATTSDALRVGVVNVNTAATRVLSCLPGVSDDLAQSIVTHRRQNGPFETIVHLLDVTGMSVALFKQLEASVTTRSSTYRIHSEGLVPSTGARRRLHAVVRLGTFDIETLNYREDP